jgi:hypothetical protein
MSDIPPASIPAKKPRAPFRVFLPLIGVGIILALYTTYWFVASDKLRATIEDFAARSPDSDIMVGWNSLAMSGFPYRIAVTFTDPTAKAPHTPENWAWSATDIEADFLPYNLRHVVLKVDGHQELHYSDARGPHPRRHVIRAKAEGTWASYVEVAGQPFGRLAIDITKLTAVRDGKLEANPASTDNGERIAAGRLQLHMQPTNDPAPQAIIPILGNNTGSYDIALQGDDVTLAPTAPTAPVLGSNITLLAVQARLRDVPHNSSASLVELSRDWLQKGGRLTVSDLRIKWGPLDLWGQGEVTLDAQARPKGQFDAEITNYPGLLAALVNAKIIRAQDAKLANVGLSFVAQLQGKADGRISVPILMNEGKLYLGPLVVAELAPIY